MPEESHGNPWLASVLLSFVDKGPIHYAIFLAQNVNILQQAVHDAVKNGSLAAGAATLPKPKSWRHASSKLIEPVHSCGHFIN
jgi:L-rhamnose mutarotase